MSLFDQLRRLYRKDKFEMEDFHTEIVAQVLRNSHGLTMAWLNGIKATSLSEPDCVTVVTQEKFAKLAGHATDSRPDIAIKVTKGAVVELILVESKVDAKQGPEQLQRYTEHLAAKTGFDHTTLVFVTREFELPHSLSKLPPNVEFRQTRWFEFYNFLKAYVNSDGLARELKLFMEKNRMSLRNQFTAIDSLALGNFRAAKSLMDETLWSEVNNEFKALGAVSSQKKAITSLANWGLYVMSASFGNADLYCHLGYYLPDEDPTEFPWVGVWLKCNPKSAIRSKVLSGFREFHLKTGNGWEAESLDDDKAWSAIKKVRHLQTFLAEPDHVRAIKEYFLSLLADVKRFQLEHRELPWSVSSPAPEEEQ